MTTSRDDDTLRDLADLQQAVLTRHAPDTQVRWIRWRGGRTQVLELGDGPPMLLVHGGFGDAFHWAPLMPALARHHRVIAVHRPGHGLADPFAYAGVDLLAHAVEFLGDVLDALELQSADFVANSLGGLWSAAFALAQPERVRSLALVGAVAGTKREIPFYLRSMTLPLLGPVVRSLMRRPTRESTRDFWRRICVSHPERLDADMLDATAASQRRNCETWFSLADRLMDRGKSLRRELILGERWSEISRPVCFVWGARDAFGPDEDGHRVARTMSDARVITLPDLGHLPWLDDAPAVAAALDQFFTATRAVAA